MIDDFENALCLGLHSDFWFPPIFPEERTGTPSEYYEVAKMVCEHCPHKSECLLAGMDCDEDIGGGGVWGGTTPSERRNEKYRPPKRYLPERMIQDVIPQHNPNVPVDLKVVLPEIHKRSAKR
jgi:hypothetical protein